MLHLFRRRRAKNLKYGGLWDNINAPGGNGYSAPATPANSTQSGPNAYTPGPGLEPYLGDAWQPSPYRQHSRASQLQPVIPVKNPMAADRGTPSRTRIRDNEWDAAEPSTLRIPDQGSQQYFNERVPLPEFTTPSVYAHQVQCNIYPGQRGWAQSYVPSFGMRANEIGIAQPMKQSRPISATTAITGSIEGHRAPISKGKAPQRKKSGG